LFEILKIYLNISRVNATKHTIYESTIPAPGYAIWVRTHATDATDATDAIHAIAVMAAITVLSGKLYMMLTIY
jgi:hypothetical protein